MVPMRRGRPPGRGRGRKGARGRGRRGRSKLRFTSDYDSGNDSDGLSNILED